MKTISYAAIVSALWALACSHSLAAIPWHKGSLASAKASAKKQNKRLLVKFTADWCSVCKVLNKKFLLTQAGIQMTQDMVAVEVDFDAPENRHLVEKYVILGLPTTIVLKPDGREAGRIMGFDGAAAFAKSLEQLKRGEEALSHLEAELRKHSADPTAMRLLGQALLERGDRARGEALLERVTWLAPSSEAAANALFVLGRYHHRVRRDPKQARHIWRELATRFPASSWAPGAWWWYARAQAELGRPATGSYALAQLSSRQEDPKTAARALRMWAGFVLKYRLKASAPAVLAALHKAIPKAAGDLRKKLKASAEKVRALTTATGSAAAK